MKALLAAKAMIACGYNVRAAVQQVGGRGMGYAVAVSGVLAVYYAQVYALQLFKGGQPLP